MRKALFAAIGAFGLAGLAFAGTAQAQCQWNGYGCGYYTYPTQRWVGANKPRWGTYGWDYGFARDYKPYPGARPGPNH